MARPCGWLVLAAWGITVVGAQAAEHELDRFKVVPLTDVYLFRGRERR